MSILFPVEELLRQARELFGELKNADAPWWKKPPEQAARVSIDRDGKAYHSVGFLLLEICVALSKGLEALAAIKMIWPAIDTGRAREELRQIEHKILGGGELVEDYVVSYRGIVLPTIKAYLTTREDLKACVKATGAEGLYYCHCRYREYQALDALAKQHREKSSINFIDSTELKKRSDSLPPEEGIELARMVRNMRIANYLFSWVDLGNETAEQRYPGLFHFMKKEEPLMSKSIQDVAGAVPLDEEEKANLRGLLKHLEKVVQETGFDFLFDAIVAGGERQGAPNQLTGNARPINIIPGNGSSGNCRPILLALAKGKGKKSRTSLAAVLEQVSAQLIECAGVTKVVVLLTDTWDAAVFQEHTPSFRAHARKGVQFLLFLVGSGKIPLSPIGVDLDRPAAVLP